MWYIVVFKLPSAETLILSLKFDQFDPFSQMIRKSAKSLLHSLLRISEFFSFSEILSQLGPGGSGSLQNLSPSPRTNKHTNLQGLGAQDVKASNFGILQAGKLTELLNYSQEMTP